MAHSIGLINIGTELLRGRTVNSNAAEIGEMLNRAGYSLDCTTVIHDDFDTIETTIREFLHRHRVVLVTGGLGPTKDDITKKVLQHIFGGEMVINAPMLRQIEDFYRRLNREMNELNTLQATVPDSCEVLHNDVGTAPGMWFEDAGRVLVSMPGVPFEMRFLMKERILPKLRKQFPAERMITRIVRTYGIPESKLAEQMEQIEGELDARVEIAYLPSFDGTKMELKLRGDESETAELGILLDRTQKKVAKFLAKYVYSLEDKKPDQLLAELLLREGITFGTAESCTGGLISAKIVGHSGVSAVHKGGIVAYQESVKESLLGVDHGIIEKEGVVSEAVAIAMAEGARKALGCEVAVSITGYAEGDLHGPEATRPQAWIGFADAKGAFAKHMIFFHKRDVNIQRAANGALILAIRQLAPVLV